jgi:hypothetical protein
MLVITENSYLDNREDIINESIRDTMIAKYESLELTPYKIICSYENIVTMVKHVLQNYGIIHRQVYSSNKGEFVERINEVGRRRCDEFLNNI